MIISALLVDLVLIGLVLEAVGFAWIIFRARQLERRRRAYDRHDEVLTWVPSERVGRPSLTWVPSERVGRPSASMENRHVTVRRLPDLGGRSGGSDKDGAPSESGGSNG